MSDEPKLNREPVENIPSVAGGISAIASANAPFTYFENVHFFGVLNGVGKVVLTASRQMAPGGGGVLTDHIVVAHLVGNIPAIRILRAALDGILLMIQEPPNNSSN
jgi:hypothetical protein